MSNAVNIPKKVHTIHYAESEGGMWDSQSSQLLDPKAIELRMYLASPDSESGWGFHFRIGLGNEALTG